MPFVAVNCGALPESLIESELFGHRKGAFTGADDNRVGLFEVAHGGTLFLDEIGELPMSMQSKLLRVLESGEIRRVGDNESFTIDVRLVCATHRPLVEMVESDQFREDLMFRINTFEVELPTLRERSDDIPELSRHLLSRLRFQTSSPLQDPISPDAMEVLVSHDWPGNVRELANVIEHATILCDEPPIFPEHLPSRFDRKQVRSTGGLKFDKPMTIREIEMLAIYAAIDRNDGNKTKAADELGMSNKTLYNKLNQDAGEKKAA